MCASRAVKSHRNAIECWWFRLCSTPTIEVWAQLVIGIFPICRSKSESLEDNPSGIFVVIRCVIRYPGCHEARVLGHGTPKLGCMQLLLFVLDIVSLKGVLGCSTFNELGPMPWHFPIWAIYVSHPIHNIVALTASLSIASPPQDKPTLYILYTRKIMKKQILPTPSEVMSLTTPPHSSGFCPMTFPWLPRLARATPGSMDQWSPVSRRAQRARRAARSCEKMELHVVFVLYQRCILMAMKCR